MSLQEQLMKNYSLWVKMEPFSFGVLPVPPPGKLAVKYLRKVLRYSKNKGPSGYPQMTYYIWHHIAVNKLQLSADISWMYFQLFGILTSTSASGRIEWDKLYSTCSRVQKKEEMLHQRNADTLQFIIFLFIQHMRREHIKQRTTSASSLHKEGWPLSQHADDHRNKVLDEEKHLSYMRNCVEELMTLFHENWNTEVVGFRSEHEMCGAKDGGSGDGKQEAVVSLEVVKALDFIIGASTDKNRCIVPFHEIAVLPHLADITGYKPRLKVFCFYSLLTWVQNNLGVNPFGISTCVSAGRRLSWPQGNTEQQSQMVIRGKMATNAHFSPRCHKMIVMTQMCHQTLARMSSTLKGSTVKVHRSRNSFIYLLSPLRSVSVDKCHSTLVVLGPIETVLLVSACRDLTVIAVCRQLIISDCWNCTFYILTPTRPILSGNKNDSITLGPYHTFYHCLEDHMEQAGIGAVPNYWDQPICISAAGSVISSQCWKLLQPERFFAFTIPFEMEGETRVVPGDLPQEYEQVLDQRESQIKAWHKMVADEGLTPAQRKKLQEVIQKRFREWLQKTGHQKEIDGLNSLLQQQESSHRARKSACH